VGLVVHVRRDLAKAVTVLARVVRAEEKLSARGQLDTEVGLGATTVATVLSGELSAGSNSSRHLGASLSPGYNTLIGVTWGST
jgi:hypothetical protein